MYLFSKYQNQLKRYSNQNKTVFKRTSRPLFSNKTVSYFPLENVYSVSRATLSNYGSLFFFNTPYDINRNSSIIVSQAARHDGHSSYN